MLNKLAIDAQDDIATCQAIQLKRSGMNAPHCVRPTTSSCSEIQLSELWDTITGLSKPL
jgi:hypothetical protein